jgi:hypothetical protein
MILLLLSFCTSVRDALMWRVLRSQAGRLYGGFAAAYPDYSAAQERAQSLKEVKSTNS